TAAALSSGPRLPRSGLKGMPAPPPGHSTGTPLPHTRLGPPAEAERADRSTKAKEPAEARRRWMGFTADSLAAHQRADARRHVAIGDGAGRRLGGPPEGRAHPVEEAGVAVRVDG